MSAMQNIRDSRGVPAKRGMRIFYRHQKRHGTIVSARDGYLKIRLDGDTHTGVYHPTWMIDYPVEQKHRSNTTGQ